MSESEQLERNRKRSREILFWETMELIVHYLEDIAHSTELIKAAERKRSTEDHGVYRPKERLRRIEQIYDHIYEYKKGMIGD